MKDILKITMMFVVICLIIFSGLFFVDYPYLTAILYIILLLYSIYVLS